MLIAVDSNNRRISPHKGATATCPLCSSSVRAYCGEINIHHWRHVSLSLCDTWKESESEWHRNWKNKFPKEWQEVIIDDGFERHIADIKTPGGLVLELQNSSISSVTIKIREQFYDNIVWLINADNFKDNFSIQSMVRSQLRYVDDGYRSIYFDRRDSVYLTNLKDELDDLKQQQKERQWEIDRENESLKTIDRYREEIAEKAKELLEMKYYFAMGVLQGFKPLRKQEFDEIAPAVDKLEKEIEMKKELHLRISNLPPCKIEGYPNHKEIKYENISPKSYHKCIMVERESVGTLFPTIVKFNSEWQFQQTARNPQFVLYVDPSERLAALVNEAEDLELQAEGIRMTKRSIQSDSEIELSNFLTQKKKETLSKIAELNKAFDNNALLLFEKSSLVAEREIQECKDHDDEIAQYEKDKEKERKAAMIKYKGLYSYYWKHRRKSWDFSDRKIYLDFKGHIFEMINDHTLRKHSYEDFIKFVETS